MYEAATRILGRMWAPAHGGADGGARPGAHQREHAPQQQPRQRHPPRRLFHGNQRQEAAEEKGAAATAAATTTAAAAKVQHRGLWRAGRTHANPPGPDFAPVAAVDADVAGDVVVGSDVADDAMPCARPWTRGAEAPGPLFPPRGGPAAGPNGSSAPPTADTTESAVRGVGTRSSVAKPAAGPLAGAAAAGIMSTLAATATAGGTAASAAGSEPSTASAAAKKAAVVTVPRGGEPPRAAAEAPPSAFGRAALAAQAARAARAAQAHLVPHQRRAVPPRLNAVPSVPPVGTAEVQGEGDSTLSSHFPAPERLQHDLQRQDKQRHRRAVSPPPPLVLGRDDHKLTDEEATSSGESGYDRLAPPPPWPVSPTSSRASATSSRSPTRAPVLELAPDAGSAGLGPASGRTVPATTSWHEHAAPAVHGVAGTGDTLRLAPLPPPSRIPKAVAATMRNQYPPPSSYPPPPLRQWDREQQTFQLSNGSVSPPQSPQRASLVLEKLDVDFSDPAARLSAGTLGELFRGEYYRAPVTVRRVCLPCAPTEDEQTEVARQRQVLTRFANNIREYECVHHPCVVQFLGVAAPEDIPPSSRKVAVHQMDPRLENPPCALIVSQYMEGGNLQGAMDALRTAPNRPPTFDLYTLVGIAAQVASGLIALHNKDLVHGDLTPSTIYLGQEPDKRTGALPRHCVAKISDFGLSIPDEFLLNTTASSVGASMVGGVQYKAPEAMIASNLPLDDAKAGDIFSLGVILYEMLTMLRPWFRCDMFSVFEAVVRQRQRPAWPDGGRYVPPPLKALIERMWSHNPSDRPSASVAYSALRAVQPAFAAAIHMSSEFVRRSSENSEVSIVQTPDGSIDRSIDRSLDRSTDRSLDDGMNLHRGDQSAGVNSAHVTHIFAAEDKEQTREAVFATEAGGTSTRDADGAPTDRYPRPTIVTGSASVGSVINAPTSKLVESPSKSVLSRVGGISAMSPLTTETDTEGKPRLAFGNVFQADSHSIYETTLISPTFHDQMSVSDRPSGQSRASSRQDTTWTTDEVSDPDFRVSIATSMVSMEVTESPLAGSSRHKTRAVARGQVVAPEETFVAAEPILPDRTSIAMSMVPMEVTETPLACSTKHTTRAANRGQVVAPEDATVGAEPVPPDRLAIATSMVPMEVTETPLAASTTRSTTAATGGEVVVAPEEATAGAEPLSPDRLSIAASMVPMEFTETPLAGSAVHSTRAVTDGLVVAAPEEAAAKADPVPMPRPGAAPVFENAVPKSSLLLQSSDSQRADAPASAYTVAAPDASTTRELSRMDTAEWKDFKGTLVEVVATAAYQHDLEDEKREDEDPMLTAQATLASNRTYFARAGAGTSRELTSARPSTLDGSSVRRKRSKILQEIIEESGLALLELQRRGNLESLAPHRRRKAAARAVEEREAAVKEQEFIDAIVKAQHDLDHACVLAIIRSMPESVAVARAGITALCHVAESETTFYDACEEGAIDELVASTSRHEKDPKVCALFCRAVETFVSWYDDRVGHLIRAVGAPATVIGVMSDHKGAVDVQTNGCQAIASICSSLELNRNACVTLGGPLVLYKAMTRNLTVFKDPELAKASLDAFRRIADKNPEAASSLLKVCAMDAVCRCTQVFATEGIDEAIIAALEAVSSYTEGRSLIIRSNGIKAVATIMNRMNDPDLLRRCCRFVVMVCHLRIAECEDEMLMSGIVEQVIRALRIAETAGSPADKPLAFEAAQALTFLASFGSYLQDRCRLVHGVHAVRDALYSHASNPYCAKLCARAVSRLCEFNSVSINHAEQNGICPALGHALEAQKSDMKLKPEEAQGRRDAAFEISNALKLFAGTERAVDKDRRKFKSGRVWGSVPGEKWSGETQGMNKSDTAMGSQTDRDDRVGRRHSSALADERNSTELPDENVRDTVARRTSLAGGALDAPQGRRPGRTDDRPSRRSSRNSQAPNSSPGWQMLALQRFTHGRG